MPLPSLECWEVREKVVWQYCRLVSLTLFLHYMPPITRCYPWYKLYINLVTSYVIIAEELKHPFVTRYTAAVPFSTSLYRVLQNYFLSSGVCLWSHYQSQKQTFWWRNELIGDTKFCFCWGKIILNDNSILSQNSISVFAQYINSCCRRTCCRLWSKSDIFCVFIMHTVRNIKWKKRRKDKSLKTLYWAKCLCNSEVSLWCFLGPVNCHQRCSETVTEVVVGCKRKE